LVISKKDTSKQFFEEALENERKFYEVLEKRNQKGHLKRGILVYSKLLRLDLKLHFSNKGIEIPEMGIRIRSPYQTKSMESNINHM
jgi:hypothetical protein